MTSGNKGTFPHLARKAESRSIATSKSAEVMFLQRFLKNMLGAFGEWNTCNDKVREQRWLGTMGKDRRGPLKNSSVFKQSIHFNTSLSRFIFQGRSACLFVCRAWVHMSQYINIPAVYEDTSSVSSGQSYDAHAIILPNCVSLSFCHSAICSNTPRHSFPFNGDHAGKFFSFFF